MARLILTGKAIKLRQGVVDIRSHQVLSDLFGEALSQLPQLQAVLLAESYGAGNVIRLSMQRSRGKKHQAAFQWIVTDDHNGNS
jgi:hypothetical protein